MLMKNPPHPGRIIRQECIEPLGLTVTAAATGLGVARKTLSEIINGRSGISPEMALRLAKAFRGFCDGQTERLDALLADNSAGMRGVLHAHGAFSFLLPNGNRSNQHHRRCLPRTGR